MTEALFNKRPHLRHVDRRLGLVTTSVLPFATLTWTRSPSIIAGFKSGRSSSTRKYVAEYASIASVSSLAADRSSVKKAPSQRNMRPSEF